MGLPVSPSARNFNTMIDKSFITEDFRAVIADDPTAISHRDCNITARRTAVRSSVLPAVEGFIEQYRFSLRAVLADFNAIPTAGELVTIGATQYRILAPVEIDSLHILVTLHLGEQFAN